MTTFPQTLTHFLRATTALLLVFSFAACDSSESDPDPADTTAPAILSASTSDGSTVTVTFNEAIDPTTVTAAAFTVTPGASVSSASGSGSSATLVLTAELDDDDPTMYTVTANGVADVAGNAANGASATFTYPAGGGGGGGSEIGAAYPNAGDSRLIFFNAAGDRFLVFNPVTGAVTDPDDIDDLENRLLPLDDVGASVSVFDDEETYFFSTDGDTFTNYERDVADFDDPASFEDEYDESGYELNSVGAAFNVFDSDEVYIFNQNGTDFQAWDVENDSFSDVRTFPTQLGNGQAPIPAVGAAVYREDTNQVYLFNREGTRYTIWNGSTFTAAFDVSDLGDIEF